MKKCPFKLTKDFIPLIIDNTIPKDIMNHVIKKEKERAENYNKCEGKECGIWNETKKQCSLKKD
jgi:hypothetical protein